MRDNFCSKWAEVSIGLNFGKEYLRMTELERTEIRIEKEQKKLQQRKNRIRLLNQRLKYLKKKEEIRKMYIGQKSRLKININLSLFLF